MSGGFDMKISGIICEYNPFHNGHLYHIQKTRENGATHLVGVMSGNFVQRGDIAVLNKLERAKTAVNAGMDLIIELPVAYSLAPAELYARCAVFLLRSLGCVDELSFGSESGDLNALSAAVKATVTCAKLPKLQELLKNGISYPVALRSLVAEQFGETTAKVLDGPNNLLAIEYLKALIFLGAKMTPFTVARRTAMHDSLEQNTSSLASASFIRHCIEDGSDYEDFIPEQSLQTICNAARTGSLARLSNLERVLLYKLRMSTPEEIAQVPEVGQGLESRIYSAKNAGSLEELFCAIKTKRYPMARIRRILMNHLIGVTKQDIQNPPPYGRILAINERGCEILAAAKGKSTIPFATSLSKLADINDATKRCASLEARSSDIFGLASRSIFSADDDFRAKISVTKSEPSIDIP